MPMNITCVNALAFIGGIGLAATQFQSLPSGGGTMAESRMQQVVSAVATLSEEVTMTDVDSVRRATMLRQRAQELTAAANREPARRTPLLSLAENFRPVPLGKPNRHSSRTVLSDHTTLGLFLFILAGGIWFHSLVHPLKMGHKGVTILAAMRIVEARF